MVRLLSFDQTATVILISSAGDISKLNDLNAMSNEDLEQALSHLSVTELDALDRYIDSNQLTSSLQKREITQEEDNDISEEVAKRWNCRKNGANTREDPAKYSLNDEQRAGMCIFFLF